MAQQRTLIAAGRRVRVERVRAYAQAAGAGWSPVYEAPGPRLVLPARGAVTLRESPGRELIADELTAFSVPAAARYQLQAEPGREDRTSVVLSGAAAAVPGEAVQAWLLAPAALLRLRLHWRALGEGRASAAQALRLTGACLRQGAALVSAAPAAGALARARRALLREPAAAHSLEEIAEAAFGSPFHLSRLFTRHLGVTPHQYRLRLRIAAALNRLEEGERDLAGLAHDLGFCGQSHFGHVFRHETGLTPAQARAALSAPAVARATRAGI